LSGGKKAEEPKKATTWNKQNAIIQIVIVLVAFLGAAIYWYLTK